MGAGVPALSHGLVQGEAASRAHSHSPWSHGGLRAHLQLALGPSTTLSISIPPPLLACKKRKPSPLALEGDGGAIPKTRCRPRQAQGRRAGREQKAAWGVGSEEPKAFLLTLSKAPALKKIKYNSENTRTSHVAFWTAMGKDH